MNILILMIGVVALVCGPVDPHESDLVTLAIATDFL